MLRSSIPSRGLCAPLTAAALALLGVAFGSTSARAASYTATFPTAASTLTVAGSSAPAGEAGFFFTTGDSVSQLFSGTGLSSVNALSFNFNVVGNVLSKGGATDFNVDLNGTTVGTYSENSTSGTGARSLNYSFAPITSNTNSYDFALVETNTVAPGLGSITLADGGTLTLNSPPAAVPEPGSLALLGLGLAPLALIARKRIAR